MPTFVGGVMFRLWNAVSKRFESDHAALTARVDSAVLEDMHKRYQSVFQLDDEIFGSQSGCMHHTQHPLPWGLVFAICGVALWLVGLLYVALIGGVYLG